MRQSFVAIQADMLRPSLAPALHTPSQAPYALDFELRLLTGAPK
jgi:hypothetical protein